MRNGTSLNVENRARVWGHILETLRRRGSVEAERVAQKFDWTVREIRGVCREMAEMNWLERQSDSESWVAGDAADELLRQYPPLRVDVGTLESDRDENRTGDRSVVRHSQLAD